MRWLLTEPPLLEQNMKDQKLPEKCERCGVKLDVSIMSKFNTDTLCERCADDERLAPGYASACAAEMAAVKQRNLNYDGIGLSAEDREFLARLRQARSQH